MPFNRIGSSRHRGRTCPATLRPRGAGPAGLGLLAATILTGCGAPSIAEQRATHAARDTGAIVVAVAWPWEARSTLHYAEGLEFARNEINAAGGIRGRRLELLRVDDGESVNQGRIVAARIARDPRILAVIGHLQSYVTVPAAAVYDQAGLPLLAPVATDPALTARGYDRVFRLTFTDNETGSQMADFAAHRGYRRIAIYYVRTDYGRTLANAFEQRAADLGIAIVARRSYDASQRLGERAFDAVLREWSELDLDAIFLASGVPTAGELIREIRRAGITAPILGGDAMSSPALIRTAGPAADGTVVAASFHPDQPTPEARKFARAFRARYGIAPDPASALGYDAVRLLAHAMEHARSLAPADIARALHDVHDWRGVTGPFTFDSAGNLIGRDIVRLVVQDGQFRYLGAPALAGTP